MRSLYYSLATSAALVLLFAENATALQFKYPFGTVAAQVKDDDHPRGKAGNKARGIAKALEGSAGHKDAWEAKYTL